MPDIGLKIGLEGEKAFKKSLSEINSSFRVLGSEIKLVSSQFDKTDKSEEAVAARSRVLNKEIAAQKDKISMLESALKNASDSFGTADKRTQNWQVQLNNAKAELNKLEGELKDNEKALDDVADEFDDAEKQADDFGDEVKQTGKQADDAESKFKKVGKALATIGKAMATATAAIGTAAVAAGKKLVDLAGETAEQGDEVDKMSQKLGMSAEAYQKWDYVLGQAGTDITSMTTGMKTLTNKIDDAKNGSEKAQGMFSKLGISMSDLQTMSREDIFAATIKGFQGMSDSTERAALANDLFGKSGQNLTPLFNESAESTEALMQAAEDLGFVMSNKAVKASADYKDSLQTLSKTFSGVKNNIVAELLPGLTSITDGLALLLTGSDGAKEKIQSGAQEIVDQMKILFPQVGDILMTLIETAGEVAPELIGSLVSGLTSGLPQIVESAGMIALSFLSSLLESLPRISDGAVSVVMTLATSILDNLPKILDVACQVIVSLANGLSSNLDRLVPSVLSTVVQVCTTLTDNLPLILDAALRLVLALAQGILQSIPQLVSQLPALIDSILVFLSQATPQIISAGIQLLGALVADLPSIISSILRAIPQILSSIFSAFSSGYASMADVGKNLVIGLWNGIVSLADWLWQSVFGWISGIWNGIKDFFGIHSPSKQMGWIGEMLVKGMADSIDENADEAVDAAENMSKGVLSAFDDLNSDLSVGVPTDFSVSGNGRMNTADRSQTVTIALNISTFNNYGVEDIRQLTNEVMVTANDFMRRRQLAYG